MRRKAANVSPDMTHSAAPPGSVGLVGKFGTPSVWLSESLAPYWIEEAKAVSQAFPIVAARRKEIIFSVAAAESFLIEWVRDSVFSGDVAGSVQFLSSRKKMGICERWKSFAETLSNDGRITQAPNFGNNQQWQDFCQLVVTRNALMHGNYSKLRQPGTPIAAPSPLPPEGIAKLPAGWAVSVVTKAAKQLCSAAGTPPPSWTVPPQ